MLALLVVYVMNVLLKSKKDEESFTMNVTDKDLKNYENNDDSSDDDRLMITE